MLLQKFSDVEINVKNMVGFGADNASVNFGCRQSIYTELKKEVPDLIQLGCLCHMLHNSIRKASPMLNYDIKCIVLKTYNEFSSSSKKTEAFKEFHEFCEMEYEDLLRHVPTRWLSLTSAVNRILKHFVPLKSYFQSQNRCPPIISKFFSSDLAEAYLGFFCHIGQLFLVNIVK